MNVSDDKIRVLFLTRTLGIGGRERQLVTLAKGLDKTLFDVTVVTFYDGGEFRDILKREPGVQVLSLGKKGRWDLTAFALRLPALMQRIRPHIIHGYGMTANDLSWLMGRLYRARVVWGVRSLAPELSSTQDRLVKIINQLGLRKWLSTKVDLIISNSQAGRHSLTSRGCSDQRMLVIPNGIDINSFTPARKLERETLRQRWRIPPDCFVFGLIARIEPNKGHKTFLRAASLLRDLYPTVRYICVGSGPKAYVAELQALSQYLGIADRVVWTGWEQDMPGVYNAIDIANTISEEREGFPNAVAEAMACGVPCVVTDIGDAAYIVGDTGKIVPVKDPESLSRTWEQFLTKPETERRALGLRARRRIEENFTIPLLVQRTQEALESLIQ